MWPGHEDVTVPGLPRTWGGPLWADEHTPWQEAAYLGPAWEPGNPGRARLSPAPSAAFWEPPGPAPLPRAEGSPQAGGGAWEWPGGGKRSLQT